MCSTSSQFLAMCPCPGGNRLYFQPVSNPIPKKAYDNNELALVLYDFEMVWGGAEVNEQGEYSKVAFDGVHEFCDVADVWHDCIDRNDPCLMMCIIDTEGRAYKSYKYNTEVLFVPYCEGRDTKIAVF